MATSGASPAKPVRLVRTLPYAPEVVWDALTDPQRLAEWMGENDFAPRVGHSFALCLGRRAGWDGVLRCRVLTLAPPRRLVFSCASDLARRGTVTISLTPVTGGTRLVLEHEGLGQRGRGLFAILLPPAWGAPSWGPGRVPPTAGATLLAVGLAMAVACAIVPAVCSGGGRSTASVGCEDPKEPQAPEVEPPRSVEPRMLIAANPSR
jgi:uncharacterized protein YndB with AHSA1/START domain